MAARLYPNDGRSQPRADRGVWTDRSVESLLRGLAREVVGPQRTRARFTSPNDLLHGANRDGNGEDADHDPAEGPVQGGGVGALPQPNEERNHKEADHPRQDPLAEGNVLADEGGADDSGLQPLTGVGGHRNGQERAQCDDRGDDPEATSGGRPERGG